MRPAIDITHFRHAEVKDWADEHGTSVDEAYETLLAAGLEQTRQEGIERGDAREEYPDGVAGGDSGVDLVDPRAEGGPEPDAVSSLFEEDLAPQVVPAEGEGSIHDLLVAHFDVGEEEAEEIVERRLELGHLIEVDGGDSVKWMGA